eukprot:1257919-Prymnesium_polylepis.1
MHLLGHEALLVVHDHRGDDDVQHLAQRAADEQHGVVPAAILGREREDEVDEGLEPLCAHADQRHQRRVPGALAQAVVREGGPARENGDARDGEGDTALEVLPQRREARQIVPR